MKTVTLTYSVDIAATQQVVFNYISDWEKQSEWVLFTSVKQVQNVPKDNTQSLIATTKLGPLKIVDTMNVTSWQPYERIVVEHTGRMVRGKGIFSVAKKSNDTCAFIWQEITPVPFGVLGSIGTWHVKPFLSLVFNYSLKKLKHNIEHSEVQH